jgi:SAM-dependent methyltransferase
MHYLPVLKGLATFIVPSEGRLRRLIFPSATQGSSHSARYCYGVWLKHLCLLWEQGRTNNSGSVAEFGPGESLGSGIAALLTGASSYTAFDARPFASVDRNLAVLDTLVQLFREQAPWHSQGWPNCAQFLDSRGFPSGVLPTSALESGLSAARVSAIRGALMNCRPTGDRAQLVRYHAPWESALQIQPESFDLIFSHSVIEYIEDLRQFYRVCWSWLRPGGWMSHQIDLSSLGMTRTWNEHWSYSPQMWRLVRGRRAFFMTGRTCSEHLTALRESGFEIVSAPCLNAPGIGRDQLGRGRINMSDADLNCQEVFVVARKP